jgi:hypothetical protein
MYSLSPCQQSRSLANKVAKNPEKKGGNKPAKGIRKYHLTQGIRAVLGSAEDKS